MSKKQQLVLTIPKPCHVGWENMTANEKGRHCGSCNKTVIDFSLYSDKELIEFFKTAKGEICGHLPKYQINRVLSIQEPSWFPWIKKFGWVAIIAGWLGFATESKAQTNTTSQFNPSDIICALLKDTNTITKKEQERAVKVFDTNEMQPIYKSKIDSAYFGTQEDIHFHSCDATTVYIDGAIGVRNIPSGYYEGDLEVSQIESMYPENDTTTLLVHTPAQYEGDEFILPSSSNITFKAIR